MLDARRPARAAAFALFVLSGLAGGPCAAAPAASTPAAAAEKPTGASTDPTAQSTPETGQTPEPTVDGAALCKQAVARLASGDLESLDSGASSLRSLMGSAAAVQVMTCLAVANNNGRFCDALPEQGKQNCTAQSEFLRELKNVPKETIKAQVFYRLCLTGTPKAEKADCDRVREAMISGNASACQSLSTAEQRDFCAGLATGDPKKCSSMADAAQREFCAAFMTDDASRCPKDAEHCRYMVRAIATLRKEGFGSDNDLDPIVAAVGKGKRACEPLLTDLERACGEHR